MILAASMQHLAERDEYAYEALSTVWMPLQEQQLENGCMQFIGEGGV